MVTHEIVNNNGLQQVSFSEAMAYYQMGRTIECRIYNNENQIIEWEKYNRCEGLEIAVEFNEILNGKWFVYIDKF